MLTNPKFWLEVLLDYKKYLNGKESKYEGWEDDQCKFCMLCSCRCSDCVWLCADSNLNSEEVPCETWSKGAMKNNKVGYDPSFIKRFRKKRYKPFIKKRIAYMNKVQIPYLKQLIKEEKETL